MPLGSVDERHGGQHRRLITKTWIRKIHADEYRSCLSIDDRTHERKLSPDDAVIQGRELSLNRFADPNMSGALLGNIGNQPDLG